jgi:hypothetical protein
MKRAKTEARIKTQNKCLERVLAREPRQRIWKAESEANLLD